MLVSLLKLVLEFSLAVLLLNNGYRVFLGGKAAGAWR